MTVCSPTIGACCGKKTGGADSGTWLGGESGDTVGVASEVVMLAGTVLHAVTLTITAIAPNRIRVNNGDPLLQRLGAGGNRLLKKLI